MSWELGRRFEFEGEAVAWERLGEGPPVVLVHGFPGHSYSWRAVAPALAREHAVYVYDMLGFGASARSAGQRVDAERQARLLAALVDAWCGEGPPDIVAHDFGAAVALGAHLFHGVPVRRLAAIDAATLNPCVSANSMHAKRHLEAYQTMPAMLYERILRAHVPTTMHTAMDEATYDAYVAPWRGVEGQAAYYAFIGQFDAAFLDRVEARLGAVRAPTLVLWGAEDTWIPLSHGARLARLIPDARLETIPGAGHFAMDDAPDAIARALLAFLDGTPARRVA